MRNSYIKNKILDLSAEEAGEMVDALADQIAEAPINDDIQHITELTDEITEEFNNWGKVSGLKTGYPSLDNMIGGLAPGHVILIGGETSNGKSALAANIAVNVSREHGVLFITLEMLQRELGARLMHINDGRIDDLDIMFQSEFRINYQDVEGLFKKAKEKGKVELVVLDYLQYLGRGMKLEEVAKMSKEMKSLALKYEVPFIVIVSLRKSEGGSKKRQWTDIEIEDFMGTGSIGYDCDVAMIASRKNLENEFDADGFYAKVLKTRTNNLDWNNRFLAFKWDKTKIIEDPYKRLDNQGFKTA
jgi:replicative DNA helicase